MLRKKRVSNVTSPTTQAKGLTRAAINPSSGPNPQRIKANDYKIRLYEMCTSWNLTLD
jgi:hypothetical protein